jgi:hypothetical protein
VRHRASRPADLLALAAVRQGVGAALRGCPVPLFSLSPPRERVGPAKP